MNQNKSLDVICLGRAAVDLYGQQIGCRLEDTSSFAKYLGGSSGNIACGAARLGLQSAMLTRVGDEHMGRFVREELQRNGVDVSQVRTDTRRLTGLVILGLRDRETFPLIFYRNDCADMALSADDIDPAFIASSRALMITGTHLSTDRTFEACQQAIDYAKHGGTRVVLDIDYRPVLWGLSGLGDGETRYISSESVSAHLQQILPACDLIVGTEEEIHIAGGSTDTITALKTIRALSDATILLKLGPQGCTVFDAAIPDSTEAFFVYQGFQVEVLNVLGAGDAFLSGFLRGWLRDDSIAQACQYANACGALVVSRHGCAPAIPTEVELFHYIANAEAIDDISRDPGLNHLHRVTTRGTPLRDELCILAFDHRKQFFEMASELGAPLSRLETMKQLLTQATIRAAEQANLHQQIGVLIDDTYGQQALNQASGRGWWIARPVELPGSRPLELEGGRNISARLKHWPREHIVKCLVFYHPDDHQALRLQQERQLRELYDACVDSGHQLLLEVIPPADMAQDDDTVTRAVTRCYNLGIYPDWWKLPSPSKAAWQGLQSVITERDPHCQGVLLLGLDAPLEDLARGFGDSAGFDICKGFAVGRTITGQPCRRWLAGDSDDDTFVREVVDNYLALFHAWRQRQA